MPITPGLRTIGASIEAALEGYQVATQVDLDAIRVALAALGTGGSADITPIITQLGTIIDEMGADATIVSGQLTQIIALLSNYVIPLEENIFYALTGLNATLALPGVQKIPPALSTVDLLTPASALHCQRVQWMVSYYFNTWLQSLVEGVGAVGIAGAGVAVTAVIVGTEGLGALPLALLSTATAAMVATLSTGIDGVTTQATLARRAALRDALFVATNASAAQTAWYATIDAMVDVNIAYRTVWKTLIWSSWFNDLFDAANHNSTTNPPLWNLAGLDGTACSGLSAGCIQYNSASVSHGSSPGSASYGTRAFAVFTADVAQVSRAGGNPTWEAYCWYTATSTAVTVNWVSGAPRVVAAFANDIHYEPLYAVGTTSYVVPAGAEGFYIDDATSSGNSFAVEVCT